MRPATLTKSPSALLVVVPVAEEVPVGVLARSFVRRPLHRPRPGTLFAVEEAEIGGVEERPRGVVDQRPACARNQPRLDGFACFVAARAVESARGALQIFGVGVARMPDDLLAVDGECDGEIVGREVAVSGRCIRSECQHVGLDRQRAAIRRTVVATASNFGTGSRRLMNTSDA